MKDWYLTVKHPNVTSGYETDEITNYAKSNYEDVLMTGFSDEVTVYNYDLSESFKVNCVVQGNVSNTKDKTLDRVALFPIGTVKSGMYVLYDGRYWLISGYPGNNKMYEKVILSLCQYLLKWQNTEGKIIERWVSIWGLGRNIGEDGNKVIYVSTNKLSVLIPDDDESMELDDKRVFIDKRRDKPIKVFKITQNNDLVYEYGEHGGILSLTADKDVFVKEKDNQELRICDYFSPTTPPDPGTPGQTGILCTISFKGNQSIVVGGNAKTFSAVYTDADGNDVSEEYETEWSIEGNADSAITMIPSGNTVKLKCSEDESLIGLSFKLICNATDNTEINAELVIELASIY